MFWRSSHRYPNIYFPLTLLIPAHVYQIDGTFRLNKPPVLLGYQHESRTRKVGVGITGEETIEMGIGSGEDTYLTMFVTIEPALTPAEPAKEKVKKKLPG